MKTIKTLLFTAICLIAISANIYAQEANTSEKKITFGVKVGLNISDIESGDNKEFNNTKAKAGFHAGVTLDYAFTPQWYLLTGLEYTSKGVKIELGGKNRDQNITAAYVQMPISAGFKFHLSEDASILVNSGPYVAYGLHGKIKTGTSHKQNTFSDYALKKFDCGLTFGAAFEWQKLCFGLGGDMGLLNVMQKGNEKAETRNFTLSVGYKF